MGAPRLVLASRSPQRRAILEQLGLEFEVVPADVAEVDTGDAREVVVENARRKARAVVGSAVAGTVLGADTAVALDGRLYGKPHDEAEARTFLEALSGRAHEVWSGIALIGGASGAGGRREPEAVAAEPADRPPGREPAGPPEGECVASEAERVAAETERVAAAVTEVLFRRLARADIDWYLASGEWRDRAGGYAIQGRGAALVERIAGDYPNVVGLPVAELVRLAPGLLRER